jgi:hypothetical protein
MLALVQIWDAQSQEVTRHVGATSRRIVPKIAKALHDGKTTRIVPVLARLQSTENVARGMAGTRDQVQALFEV